MALSKQQLKKLAYERLTDDSNPTPEEARTYDKKRPGEPGYLEAMGKKYGFPVTRSDQS